jgi:hypothetical protein
MLRIFAAVACVAAASAVAQNNKPLDLTYRAESKGTVIAVRDVYAAGKGPTPASTQNSSAPESSLDTGLPVGAVAYWSFGPGSSDGVRVGAVGRGDIQPWVTDHAREVVVKMDGGEQRAFRPANPDGFRVNDRVTVRGGELERL